MSCFPRIRNLKTPNRFFSTLALVASVVAAGACSAGGGSDTSDEDLDQSGGNAGGSGGDNGGGAGGDTGGGSGGSGGDTGGGSGGAGGDTGGGGAGGDTGGGGTTGGLVDEGDEPILIVDDNRAPPPGCGNKDLTADEACDDGNLVSGDGCSENCLQVEPGFSCAAPGESCREIARCGDGLVAATEQCDDGNAMAGDGCSDRCKVERGKKCEGTPSVCTDAECGNGMKEGAEGCDDGNTAPFDGCSSLCLREPNCEGTACTSECGDGLKINEDCDDGNTISGDGCSSDCKVESGFTCTQETLCEQINGECVLRVPAIFRDFSDDDDDFGWGSGDTNDCKIPETDADGIIAGIAKPELDEDGRPELDGNPDDLACIKSAASFAQWFRGGVEKVGDLVLFDNGEGGYVNRFGADGEQLVVTEAGPDEQQVNRATSPATCEPGCAERVQSGLQCNNVCQPDTQAVHTAEDKRDQVQNQLTQAEDRLEQAEEAATPDEEAIADAQAEVDEITLDLEAAEEAIAEAQATADTCTTECQTDFDAQVAVCVADCKPCSYNPQQYCTGGEYVYYDGTPLFFPVDDITGPTADLEEARIPEQYGYVGWPWEEDVFPGAGKHNFYFTSEVQYWFRYEADTNATLEFTGDDDVFVFVNGHLAVDLGGIHVPIDGSVTINAQTAGDFGLQAGNVYKITVFQAERKIEGSSFRLTLSGFEATPSDCSAVCGDGILSFGEECDDGINDGGYGECDVGCKLGPFCGDKIVQENEQCDNGPIGGTCPGCRMLQVR